MQINRVLLESHPNQNFTVGRDGHDITGIVLHTMVGTIDSAQERFSNPSQAVTAHYGVGLNGEIRQWIEEGNTAWQAGNWQVNLTTIGIEHEDNGDYNGARTDALYNSSSDLVADLCRRYNIPCDRDHIKGHREVIDRSRYPGGTACPDALDVDRIVREAAAKLNAPAPAPVASPQAPQPAAERYTVYVSVPGYRTSSLAAQRPTTTASVAPGTYYVFNQANGMVNVTSVAGEAGSWINPADNAEPAATPAQAPAPAPAPVHPANITFTKLEKPLNLVTKQQPTHVWELDFPDYTHVQTAELLDDGAPFVAYGKAQRTDLDHPCYYMSEQDFGQADATGIPVHNQGINTVDLAPAPAPAPEPAQPAQIKIVDNSGAPEPLEAPAESPAPVAPTKPDTPPEGVIFTAFLSPQQYMVKEDVTVQDLAGKLPDKVVKAGTTFKKGIGGKILYKGAWFYRTQAGVEGGTWYAFPVTKLRKLTKDDAQNGSQQLDESVGDPAAAPGVDADIDQIAGEVSQLLSTKGGTVHDTALKVGGTAEGLIIRILRALHLIK